MVTSLWKPQVNGLALYQGQIVEVKKIDQSRCLISLAEGQGSRWVAIEELGDQDSADDERKLFRLWETATKAEQAKAKNKAGMVRELMRSEERSADFVKSVASKYGLSLSTAYRALELYDGTLDSLLPKSKRRPLSRLYLENQLPNEKRDKRMIAKEVEEIIRETIDSLLKKVREDPTGRKLKVSEIRNTVIEECEKKNLLPPSIKVIAGRLTKSDRMRLLRRTRPSRTWKRHETTPGVFNDAKYTFAVWQIDHALLNVVVVDSETRKPIGRPWITVCIDVYSRCVVSFRVSLDPPSSDVTGLCISRAILPKDAWLNEIGFTPERLGGRFYGLPSLIHADNGKDFRSDSITDACIQYDIGINWRPIGKAHWGGHIESYLGNLKDALKVIKGATFRRDGDVPDDYDPNKYATFDLGALEKWLAEQIFGVYHNTYHSGIEDTPISHYNLGIKNVVGSARKFTGKEARRLRIRFLPRFEATFQNDGVTQWDITWWNSNMRSIVAHFGTGKGKSKPWFFHYDPSGIKKIYYLNPLNGARDEDWLSATYPVHEPNVALWEVKAANRERNEQRKKIKDDPQRRENVFEAVKRMRELEESQLGVTKSALRKQERRRQDKTKSNRTKAEIGGLAGNSAEKTQKDVRQAQVPVEGDDVLAPPDGARWVN